jgi:hypothetical protein
VPLVFWLNHGVLWLDEGRNDGALALSFPLAKPFRGAGEGSDEFHDGGSAGLERDPRRPPWDSGSRIWKKQFVADDAMEQEGDEVGSACVTCESRAENLYKGGPVMATKAPMAGWIVFAATIMMIVGFIDFFEGLIAVVRKHYYVVAPNQVIVFNTTTWGWLTLIWGIVIFLVGLALWSGSGWARWLTVVVASINILGQLAWLGSSAWPLWALVAIGLNITVIYALTARWAGYPEAVGRA